MHFINLIVCVVQLQCITNIYVARIEMYKIHSWQKMGAINCPQKVKVRPIQTLVTRQCSNISLCFPLGHSNVQLHHLDARRRMKSAPILLISGPRKGALIIGYVFRKIPFNLDLTLLIVVYREAPIVLPKRRKRECVSMNNLLIHLWTHPRYSHSLVSALH